MIVLFFLFFVVINSHSNMHKISTRLIPRFSNLSRKGSHGKIAVIGGSFEYTGAPYYAALSALRTGADLVWIFCSEEAAIPIKSYSPEPIVLPILPTRGKKYIDLDSDKERIDSDKERIDAAVSEFERLAPRFDSVICGPGLGRDDVTLQTLLRILEVCKRRLLPTVIDGDALFYLSTSLEAITLLKTSTNWPVVLTPNIAEFKRLWPMVCSFIEYNDSRTNEEAANIFFKCLSVDSNGSSLYISLLLKGQFDIIASADVHETLSLVGSPRRCGGQGDILTGSVATFLAWAKASHLIGTNTTQYAIIDHTGDTLNTYSHSPTQLISACAFGGAMVTRQAALLAFSKKKRATTTPDILEEIGESFEITFPDLK
jgi:ATP-dependent NAD(P)H-hydrate dehydratase